VKKAAIVTVVPGHCVMFAVEGPQPPVTGSEPLGTQSPKVALRKVGVVLNMWEVSDVAWGICPMADQLVHDGTKKRTARVLSLNPTGE
jgi:hypothetical protein